MGGAEVDQNQTPRATIAWHSPDAAGSFNEVRSAFAGAGYALCPGPGDMIDINVLDLRSGLISARQARQSAADQRRRSPETGIVFMVNPDADAAERAHARRSGDVVFPDPEYRGLIHACRQRLRVRNIAEETGERLKSIAALTRLSEFPPIETSSAPPNVLIAGDPGSLALCAIAKAGEIADRCDAALSASQAMRALESGLYDCAVFLPRTSGDPLLGLARTMRRHRRFQDLPVIAALPEAQGAGRADLPSNVELVAPAHLEQDLPARLLALTRRARLMSAMRRFLNACAGDGVRDRICGAFTPAFFGQHAERVFARADQTGRATSLVGLRLASTTQDDLDVGGVRTLSEAARLVNRVTRAEDCVGRLTSDTFITLMCATTRRDAEIAARRVEGVLANTMFRSRGAKRLFAVAAATTAVERKPRQHLEETLAQVLCELKAATPRTAER